MKIYLIGMPGSGKSTLGKELAKKLNYKYIDLDEYIQINAFMYIDEIFEMYGEKYFRDLETNMLQEVSKTDEDIIISCGGGIVIKKENKELMTGLKIYLDVEVSVLETRLKDSMDTRPLFRTNTVNDLYLERKDKYDYFSDFKVKNNNIEQTISMIVEEVEKHA